MSGEVNWKGKYTELKSKFMKSVDMAFRLGFEQGQQQAQLDQAAQQQQQQQEMEAQAQGAQPGGGAPGEEAAPGQEAAAPGQPPQESAHPDGTELDQHIAKLEGMLGKSEISSMDLQKAVAGFKQFQAEIKQAEELRKSDMAITGIAKALHRPSFKIGKVAAHNMTDNAKTAVSMQQKIVTDMMKSWAEEESKAKNDISNILGVEGLTNK